MLSIFPTLLDYWLVAPVILRVALGLSLIYEVRTVRKVDVVIPLIKVCGGIFLLLGLYTQLAALISAIIFLYELWGRRDPAGNDYRRLKLAVAVALLFLGPGFLAIDLPL
ncbi:MAG: hypothetical protein AAB505_02035 [Patescibacteria group bacterium]